MTKRNPEPDYNPEAAQLKRDARQKALEEIFAKAGVKLNDMSKQGVKSIGIVGGVRRPK